MDNATKLANAISAALVPSYQTRPDAGSAELLVMHGTNPVLRDVVNKIAYAVADSEWHVYRVPKRPGERKMRARLRSFAYTERKAHVRMMAEYGDLEPVEDHPLLSLVYSPCPAMTGFSARRLVQAYLDTTGEAFLQINRDSLGVPFEAWPIPPTWIQETPAIGDEEDGHYRMRVGAKDVLVPASEMVWLKDHALSTPYGRGRGTGLTLGDEIETVEYASKFAKTFFLNRAKPELIISAEGVSKEEAARAEETFANKFRGALNAYKTFWTGSALKIQELTSKFSDLGIVALQKYLRDTIGQTYGVPPELRGIVESSNRATIENAEYIFAKYVVRPRLEFLRQEYQHKLAPMFDEELLIDFDSPVDDDYEFRLRVLQSYPDIASRDEWRELAGLPEDPDYVEPAEEDDAVLDEERSASSIIFTRDAADDAVARLIARLDGTEMAELTQPIQIKGIAESGEHMMGELAALSDAPIAFDKVSQSVVDFLDNYSTERIGWITDTTRSKLQKTLRDAILLGESELERIARVRDVFADFPRHRAQAIARTEVFRAQNFSRLESMLQSGVVPGKQWVAQLINTRDAHARLHRKAVAVDDVFVAAGGDTAQYPMQFGKAELDVNCQCKVVPYFGQIRYASEIIVREDGDDDRWDLPQSVMDKWIDDMIAAVNKAAANQEAAIVAAVRG